MRFSVHTYVGHVYVEHTYLEHTYVYFVGHTYVERTSLIGLHLLSIFLQNLVLGGGVGCGAPLIEETQKIIGVHIHIDYISTVTCVWRIINIDENVDDDNEGRSKGSE